ncbi:hypothetical protein D3C72_933910 [compost metagenome]
MALGWYDRFSSSSRMSRCQIKGTRNSPANSRHCVSRRSSKRGSISSGSTLSGHSPINPMITALSVPWPIPVADSEPYNRTSIRCTCASISRSRKASTNRAPARIGPTVWELEGPTPILNKSKTLIAIVDLRAASKVSGIHPIVGVRNHQGVSDIDS